MVCDAELRARHRWNQDGDGEVPDGFREVHGYAAWSCEWCGVITPARVSCAVGVKSRLRTLDKPKAPARDRRGFSLQIFGATQQTIREINNPDAVNLHSLWNSWIVEQ